MGSNLGAFGMSTAAQSPDQASASRACMGGFVCISAIITMTITPKRGGSG
jgi:hypothetical protein